MNNKIEILAQNNITDPLAHKISWEENRQKHIGLNEASLVWSSEPGILKVQKSISNIATSIFVTLLGGVIFVVFFFIYLLAQNPLLLLFGLVFSVPFIWSGVGAFTKKTIYYTFDFNQHKLICSEDKSTLMFDELYAIQLIHYVKYVRRTRMRTTPSRGARTDVSTTEYTTREDHYELNLVKKDASRTTITIVSSKNKSLQQADMLSKNLSLPVWNGLD